MFNLSKGDESSSLNLIQKVYDVSPESGQDAQTILDQLKKQVKKKDAKTNGESYCQSLFGSQYWRGTVILTFYAVCL